MRTEATIEFIQVRDTLFHAKLNWNLTPNINVLLERNGFGKTLLLRTLVYLIQYDDGNALQTVGNGNAEISILLGNQERSISFLNRFLEKTTELENYRFLQFRTLDL